MSYEQRGTWVYLFVSVAVYAAYVIVVLTRAADPMTETAYQLPLLWSIGAAIVASIVLRVVVEIGAGVARGIGDEAARRPRADTHASAERIAAQLQRVDARDREIDQLGNQRTWIVVALAALAAMLMALAEWHFFWIANVIFLGFVLQAVASSIVKLVLYRRGF